MVEYAVQAGLATDCRINLEKFFSRKNYFYPDLPKGYQISQFEQPICENGFLNIETSRGTKKVNIQRIHMEEDAGKNVHMTGYSLVNLNRAGVPLCEVVSGPRYEFGGRGRRLLARPLFDRHLSRNLRRQSAGRELSLRRQCQRDAEGLQDLGNSRGNQER